MENVLSSRAVLAGVRICGWSARKLDRKVTDEVNAQHGAAHDAGRYNKALLANGALARITTAANEARSVHYARTLPWLDDGARILPAAAYDDYSQAMRRIKNDYEAAVSEFVEKYPCYVQDARRRLNGMFREADYPSASDIASRFSFDVRILPVPDARDFRVAMGDAQADALRADVERATRDALEFAMRDAWERMAEVTRRMVERLSTYKPGADGSRAQGIFRDSLVENVRELVAMLPAFNLANNPAMADIAARMERELCAHNADELRDSEALRQDVATAAQSILADVSAFLA